MCLTKQPSRKKDRRYGRHFTGEETQLNLISREGTHITIRYHFKLNYLAKIMLLTAPSKGRMGLKGNCHLLLVGIVNCYHLFGKDLVLHCKAEHLHI